MEFYVNNRVSERHVACRMAMLVGTSDPLAWGPQDVGLPGIVAQTHDGYVWDLGSDFKLTRMAPERYRLAHPDLKEVETFKDFLEWEFLRLTPQPQHTHQRD